MEFNASTMSKMSHQQWIEGNECLILVVFKPNAFICHQLCMIFISRVEPKLARVPSEQWDEYPVNSG